MFRLLDYLKQGYNAYRDPSSFQLMEILRPETGSPTPQEAQRFIENNQDKTFNFYFTKTWMGIRISIIQLCCYDPILLNSILNHPSMRSCKSHDWKLVFECFTSAIANDAQSQLTLLTNFFKPRLPLNQHLPNITACLAQAMPFDLDEVFIALSMRAVA